MTDSTEVDTYVLFLGIMALTPGLVIHSFIIGVYVTDWWKGRSVTPVDHIVTSLGISRICAQCTITLYFFIDIFSLSRPDTPITLVIIGSIYHFFSYANFWLTSLLSIVYCLKISNLHSRLFLYLRGMIVHRTVYFIGATVFLSTVYSLITLFLAIREISSNGTYNITIDNLQVFKNCMHINYMYNSIIGALFPFLFSCISSVLLFTTLYHHTRKMSSNLSINLETYFSALKLISLTFLYSNMYYIGHFANSIYYYFYCSLLPCFFIVLDFLPVLHSSYLIYRTAKLRSQMSKVLQNVIDFIFQRKDTENRENIEIIAL